MKRCDCGQYPDVCARYGHRRIGEGGEQSVKRSTVTTTVVVHWDGIPWDDLPAECREYVREHIDRICDRLDIEAH